MNLLGEGDLTLAGKRRRHGQRLAFFQHHDDLVDLFILAADGTVEKRMTLDVARTGSLSWDAEGKQIVFHACVISIVRRGNDVMVLSVLRNGPSKSNVEFSARTVIAPVSRLTE